MDLLQLMIPPIFGGIVGFGVWYLQTKVEQIKRAKERLQDERRKIYSLILDPYIEIMHSPAGNGANKALKAITSLEYKKKAFEFNLIGDDNVVNAFNNMMLHYYNMSSEAPPSDTIVGMKLFGELLLEVRKSVNNPNTSLEGRDMLISMIKDYDSYIANH